jgi:hypothetical protein
MLAFPLADAPPYTPQEIRDHANAIFALIQPIQPMAAEAWSAPSTRVGLIDPLIEPPVDTQDPGRAASGRRSYELIAIREGRALCPHP